MSTGIVATTRDDRGRMDPQIATDRPVPDARRLQQRRRAQGAGRQDDVARPDDERSHARPRVGAGHQCAALDTDGAAALDQHLGDPDLGHDAGAGRGGSREVDTDAGLLRSAPTAERATATVVTGDGVATRQGRLPAEPLGADEDDLVLRRLTAHR